MCSQSIGRSDLESGPESVKHSQGFYIFDYSFPFAYNLEMNEDNYSGLFISIVLHLFTLSNAKHGESIVIGLAASSTSKDSQVKTTEPMDSIKVTNCIQ